MTFNQFIKKFKNEDNAFGDLVETWEAAQHPLRFKKNVTKEDIYKFFDDMDVSTKSSTYLNVISKEHFLSMFIMWNKFFKQS